MWKVIFWIVIWILLILLPIRLLGQVPEVLRVEGEESAYVQYQTDAPLDSPAEPAACIFIQSMTVARIVTLHRETPADSTAKTITLVYGNGGYDVGTWEATVEPDPEHPGFCYWIVQPNEEIFPGRYTVAVSDLSSWINTAKTGREGIVWIFGRKEGSM